MKKFIGWIETILGFFISIASIAVIFSAKTLIKLESTDIPIDGVSESLDSIFALIPGVLIAYFVILLILGVFILLEGLSKLGAKKTTK